MDGKQQYKELRPLINKLEKERKKQAKKIDILCNDFIAEQRDFIKKLDTISFAANFYEEIIGAGELAGLLHTAGNLIKEEIPDANVVFFLRQAEGFELHLFKTDQPITPGEHHPFDPASGLAQDKLESCFGRELAEGICKSNKLCTLDDMFAMGLEGNLTELNKISAVTIPLGWAGSSLGFVLIYRPSTNKLTAAELNNIAAVTPGLSRAIASCQALLHPAD